MPDEKNNGFFTFLSGAVIGAALGLLFAPQTGKETRKQLRDAGEKASEEIKEKYDTVAVETKKGIETIKSVTDEAIKNIKKFTETLRIKEKKTVPKAKAKSTSKS